MDPPSVEGWHTGKEWINSSTLIQRVNFAAKQFSDVESPGVQSIVSRIRAQGAYTSPEQLVDSCLELMGPMTVIGKTMDQLLSHVSSGGEIRFGDELEARSAAERISELLQLIASTREYQMA